MFGSHEMTPDLSRLATGRTTRHGRAHTSRGGATCVFDLGESFAVNRFEQLCINYANERLQQKFTLDLFKTVQASQPPRPRARVMARHDAHSPRRTAATRAPSSSHEP